MHIMKKEVCVFCEILAGNIKQSWIYEDALTAAFLDIRPASPRGGHTLVVPKKHYELLSDVPDVEIKALSITLKKVSKALLKFGEGVNVVQNNKRVAGQYVKHVHFHVIPRFANDGVKISETWSANPYHDGEMEKTAEKIKRLL